jgi:CRP/FNR family transcriptional regulator
VVDAHPALGWALIESLAHRARHLVDLVQDLSMRDVKGRLARLLLEQAQADTTQTAPRLLTQEEMASQLGTVREVVGRALRTLTTQGIIKFDRHRIIILDQERLAEAAEA